MLESLEKIEEILEEISNEPKRNGKEKIISEYISSDLAPTLIKVILYAYNPFKKYNVTEVHFIDSNKGSVEEAFKYLEHLSEKKGCSDIESKELNELCSIDADTSSVFNKIVKKDLRCGVGLKTWKKFVDGFPDHEVMLCIDDLDKFFKAVPDVKNICWSIKLDGVRCIANVMEDGTVKYLSRNGLEFENFGVFDSALIEAAYRIHKQFKLTYPISFDGEVTSADSKFDNLMSQVRRLKEIDPTIFRYSIFDIICNAPFNRRYETIKRVFMKRKNGRSKYNTDLTERYTGITCVWHHQVKPDCTKDDLIALTDELCHSGEEGIVCKDWRGAYYRKRHNSWCKVKKFYTIDLEVIGAEYGTGRNKDVLGALTCVMENGNKVRVGSGFSDEERKTFIVNAPEMIEVKYQNESKDSLRFPVFVRVREDK